VRAQVTLVASAFLFGGVLAALLFVGVWRHTAAEGDRARQAQAAGRQALRDAQAALALSQRRLALSRAQAVGLAAGRDGAIRESARLQRINAGAAMSLRPHLQAIASDAAALTHETARLDSAASTLRDYIRNASSAEIDPVFLAAQTQYLIGATRKARSAVADVASQVSHASATVDRLRRTR
jgi:hypothetical protein